MAIGRVMNVARNASGETGLTINRPVLSPLGGGLLPARWVTRRQYSRNSVKSNTNYRFHLPTYASKSQSFSGVSSVYGVPRGAFTRGGYVK